MKIHARNGGNTYEILLFPASGEKVRFYMKFHIFWKSENSDFVNIQKIMQIDEFQVKYEKVLPHAGDGISLNFMIFLMIHRKW